MLFEFRVPDVGCKPTVMVALTTTTDNRGVFPPQFVKHAGRDPFIHKIIGISANHTRARWFAAIN